jgi:TM2 domain-containing membrane protein YozV
MEVAMKVLGVIVNIFIPGIGSLIVGKIGTGILQFILYCFGVILTITAIGAIIGVPLCIIVWIWSIVTAVKAEDKPVQVVVVKE